MDATQLLRAWREGDESALERLMPIVYEDLRRLARRHLIGERAGHSLQATALVNEAYMRLVDYKRMQWQDRAHFLAVSAQLMRRILVEHARRHNLKRGGDVQHLSLDDAAEVGGGRSRDLVALDDALNELARFDARKARARALDAGFRSEQIVRYAVRPFDTRWCYYSDERPIWNEPRPTLWAQCFKGNSFLLTRMRCTASPEGFPISFSKCLSDDHYIIPDAVAVPFLLRHPATTM